MTRIICAREDVVMLPAAFFGQRYRMLSSKIGESSCLLFDILTPNRGPEESASGTLDC